MQAVPAVSKQAPCISGGVRVYKKYFLYPLEAQPTIQKQRQAQQIHILQHCHAAGSPPGDWMGCAHSVIWERPSSPPDGMF